jgi:hypothetical protein
MSYLMWDQRYEMMLEEWSKKICAELISRKRFLDVALLMNFVSDFYGLSYMSYGGIDPVAQDWLSMSISGLASSLSQSQWDEKNRKNQDICIILQEISDFMNLNNFQSLVAYGKGTLNRLKIPNESTARLLLDF